MPINKTIKMDRYTFRLICCMHSMPAAGLAASSDLMMKSENAKNIPATSAHEITARLHPVRINTDVILLLHFCNSDSLSGLVCRRRTGHSILPEAGFRRDRQSHASKSETCLPQASRFAALAMTLTAGRRAKVESPLLRRPFPHSFIFFQIFSVGFGYDEIESQRLDCAVLDFVVEIAQALEDIVTD